VSRADLHVHSNASDGTDPPAEVMRRAAAVGLDVVALTDHDTTAGHDEARAALPPGLTLFPGMELSCQLGGRSVHMLAYLFDPDHAELAAETALIRDDRVHRARAMVARLNYLGANVTWDDVAAIAGTSVVGRPHIARAMAQAGVVDDPADAFTSEWIGDDGRAYVEKYALVPARAIALVRAAGGVSVLAHPRAGSEWDLSGEEIAGLAAAGLAGLEVWHPDHTEKERRWLLATATELDLIPTGGSDDHGQLTGYSIARETAAPDTVDRLLARAGGR
jgi:predicted metal-dependent phosphoesterase TrpH